MPLKEELILQVVLAATSRLELLDWVEQYAAQFRSLVETNEGFVRLARSNPAAAQRRL